MKNRQKTSGVFKVSAVSTGALILLAMLFSAGMGIGLVFYGAAEPLSHYAVSAPDAELYSAEALSDAM